MRRRTLLLLTVMMAVLVVASGTALAITYTTSKKASLKLNRDNFVGTALTMLASNAVGPVLTLDTDNTDSSSTPLALKVQDSSQAPMTVDSETKVANLNVDKIDDQDSTAFLGANAKAADADKLDGKESTAFLPSSIYQRSESATDTCNPAQTQCTTPGKTVNCNAGDQAISGGFDAIDVGTTIVGSHPSNSGQLANVSGWTVSWRDDSSTSKDTLTVYVVCANL